MNSDHGRSKNVAEVIFRLSIKKKKKKNFNDSDKKSQVVGMRTLVVFFFVFYHLSFFHIMALSTFP